MLGIKQSIRMDKYLEIYNLQRPNHKERKIWTNF